jgi:hypothetical protein
VRVRKALIVGIDYYERLERLQGCVNDAQSVNTVLERHADGKVNFATPRLMVAGNRANAINRADLKAAVRELFECDGDIALFYFAGHGHMEDTGGFLCASDCETGDDGLPLTELMSIANKSLARNKVIILDSCHSGIAGNNTDNTTIAEIKEGTTLLTASTAEQYASEENESGVFTRLLVDALSGSAANLVGDVTPGSVYAHIDQSLGPWAQRPVFKTNVKTFVSLRKAVPPISLLHLQTLSKLFPNPGYVFSLDPSYEPERPSDIEITEDTPSPDPAKTEIFKVLQEYVKVNLVRPVGATHMYHAAMQSKACELTVLGEHYRRLVANGLI